MVRQLFDLIERARNTAVGWMLINNCLRLGTGIVLLALVGPKFSDNELRVYTLLWQLYTFVVIIDATIGANMIRFFGYAMGGATNLQSLGSDFSQNIKGPNYGLVGSLMRAAQRIYSGFGISLFVFLIGLGALILNHSIQISENPQTIWLALALTALAGGLEVFFGWWLAVLNGINQVVISSRLSTFAQGMKLLIAAALLVLNVGLLAVPIASLISGVTLRMLARREVRRILPDIQCTEDRAQTTLLIRKVAPMCRRVGAVLAGRNLYIFSLFYVAANSPTHIDDESSLTFLFSFMLLTFVASVSATWTQVKWPLINRLRSESRFEEMRNTLFPRFWLTTLTVLAGSVCMIGFFELGLGKLILGKSILGLALLIPLAINFLLETLFSFWTTLLTTDNRVPSLWPTLAHYVIIATSVAVLVHFGNFGVGALVWTPLIVGCLFNYWYWGFSGSRYLKTTFFKFLMNRS